VLRDIELPSDIDRYPVPADVTAWLTDAAARIQTFQDRWRHPHIELFVAADYELVFQALAWTLETQMTIGMRFVEWGCGFAVISGLASGLGLDAVGIEAEPVLVEQGRRTVARWGVPVELVEGNFLPRGAESLADDPTLPSLGHAAEPAYDELGLDLDDFAVVYSYPWPGEDEFHRRVFERHSARGALLLQFIGPYDIRLMRNTTDAR